MNNKDKILCNYYAGVSKLIENSFLTASSMAGKGFSLLCADFGGYVDAINQAQSSDIEIFEIERIKEEVISLLTCDKDGVFKRYGYKSQYLDEELSELGVTRDDLYGINRNKHVENAIKSKPWGFFYANDFRKRFVKLIDEGVIAAERIREANFFNLQPLAADVETNLQLTEYLHRVFLKLGLRKIKNRYKKYQSIYVTDEGYANACCGGTKTHIEFAVHTDSMAKFRSPCSIEIYFKPVIHGGQNDCSYNEFDNNVQLFKNISLLIPGFGVYRVARNPLEASLMLHAHRDAIERIVNAFSAICLEESGEKKAE